MPRGGAGIKKVRAGRGRLLGDRVHFRGVCRGFAEGVGKDEAEGGARGGGARGEGPVRPRPCIAAPPARITRIAYIPIPSVAIVP